VISWFPLACFGALIATMAVVSILPPSRHLAYAFVEWAEMILGSASAVIVFVIVIVLPRVSSPAAQRWTRYKWPAIGGLCVWCIFWLVALMARPWAD
jgi:hypothetical protein